MNWFYFKTVFKIHRYSWASPSDVFMTIHSDYALCAKLLHIAEIRRVIAKGTSLSFVKRELITLNNKIISHQSIELLFEI